MTGQIKIVNAEIRPVGVDGIGRRMWDAYVQDPNNDDGGWIKVLDFEAKTGWQIIQLYLFAGCNWICVLRKK